ncbi:ABC transporter substrate-binding protein [Bosea sp. (in: a-proteobacteria)]|uniref:ABC transporter substrate-binding protein n=1 Tax=Bosea sp. (in: a-proteobacteria) TaxID=1871050 RepID=UPI001AC850E8|nr:ABC transporter substrate-binding protein [Bosea sp. (in: a-proteobacteria)]MBN9440692.1 ABC transporter substrate-binding protein [Bosea sp. (in: a-proteobacteria)]
MTDHISPRRFGALSRRNALKLGAGALALTASSSRLWAQGEPIRIGLSAAFSGPNAQAGQALQRGADLAIDEINAAGGVLGRKLELVTRDNEHKLDRGVAQARELVEREKCVSIIGSQGSFIGVAVIDTMDELQVPWFGTSVGGVGIIENGRKPNYMFRVATNDRDVARFLVNYGLDKVGSKQFGILVEDTGWGVPAIEDLKAALKARGLEAVSIDKVKVGDADFTPQILRASKAGADTIATFTNTVEMANSLKAANKIGYKPKVIGAWGLAGANFPSLAGALGDGVMVMQTFTFVGNEKPKAKALLQRLMQKNPDIKDVAEIPFPSYIGNTYDTVHMIALSIQKSGGTEGPKMLGALESLGTYDGLIKAYDNPFSATDHEALSPEDYAMTVWKGPRLELMT